MVATKYILRYRLEGDDWREFPLDKDQVILGRSSDSDLVLEHDEVSRHHASLSFEKEAFSLTDLNSANGVWINGERIPPLQKISLPLGQSFTISKFTLSVETAEPAPPFPVEAPVAIPSQYTLCYRAGKTPWQEYPLTRRDVVLGRAPDCELPLEDDEVSRHHARFRLKPDGVWLTDLGSTNSTQLEGNPLSPRKPVLLRPGQTFTIGPFTMKVEARAPSSSQPPVAAPPASEKTIIAPPELQESTAPYTLDLATLDHIAIGRAQDNDLVLNHPVVSGYHAEIERLGTRFHLRDLRSTNGVFVNGQRVDREVWLKDKDSIQIGPYLLNLVGQNLSARTEIGLYLKARNLNQRVSRRLNLLQNLNLSIKPMELVAVVGMSGSGKSTLLNALSGYRPASDGLVLVNGVDLYKHYDAFRNDMGYVPQKDIVHTELTPMIALDYVARLRMPADTSQEERHKAVLEVLAELDLTERKDVPISRLSGGQLKRVSIGVELLTKPRLFFLDEPTSGLDPGTEYEMMRLMRRLADQGRTVILVTHATKNVSLCDKVVFLARGGNLAFFGPPEEALSYFDAYRSTRERQQKEMEFDDIYRILNDEKRGTPSDWGKRYQASPFYTMYCTPSTVEEEKPDEAQSEPTPRPLDTKTHLGRASS